VKVLIIGGAGFIGGFLIKRLIEDQQISRIDILDNFYRSKKDNFLRSLFKNNKKIFLLKKNIINFKSYKILRKDYQIIFQFAALLGVQNVIDNPQKVIISNFLIMQKSLEIAKNQKKLKKFIYLSTSEVYAGALENFKIQFPTPENSSLALTKLSNPRTSYMLSKIYGEAMCIYSGVPYLILRPHNIYGPRMGSSHVIPELLSKILKIKKNKYLYLNSHNHKRAFCYVEDAINQIYQISKNKIFNETVNIGNNNEEISIFNLCKKILQISNRKDIKIKKKSVINYSPIRRLPYMSKLFWHIEKTKFTKLEDGIKKTFEWYNKI
jgi:nucleoside-diphosphate-sugar epimerase